MNLSAILGNQAFTALAGTAIVSAALYQLRAIPTMLWAVLTDQFSASLSVYSEQEVFRSIDLWLGRHPSAKRARRVALTEWWDQVQGSNFEMTPGEGPHLLWQDRRPIFINRQVETAPSSGGMSNRRQTIRMVTVGRSRALLERVIAEARTVQERDVVSIHIWRGHGYELVERRPRRALETVYLAKGLRDLIVHDAERFVARKAWYMERGIPHRRGYLFEGPPGTGKSTMALALAGALHRSVYIINPSAVSDDNALQSALNQAGSGLVLIEDIDAVHIGKKRVKRTAIEAPAPATSTESEGGISQSGLLNAIDGVAARDGRILVITSNHADQLDPALVRPGRVDLRCNFAMAGEAEAIAMFSRFRPGEDHAGFISGLRRDLPLSQAELQNRLLREPAEGGAVIVTPSASTARSTGARLCPGIPKNQVGSPS